MQATPLPARSTGAATSTSPRSSRETCSRSSRQSTGRPTTDRRRTSTSTCSRATSTSWARASVPDTAAAGRERAPSVSAGPVRPSPIAGSWYPGDARAIRAEVDRYLADVPATALPGRLIGLIAPHAGLRYSGPVAAHAYATLRGRDRVVAVLVGPSHRAAFDGVALYDARRIRDAARPRRDRRSGGGAPAGRQRRRRGRRAAAPPRALPRDAAPVPPAPRPRPADRPAPDGQPGPRGSRCAGQGAGPRGRRAGRPADRVQRPQPLPPGAGREPARRRGDRGGGGAAAGRASWICWSDPASTPAGEARWSR